MSLWPRILTALEDGPGTAAEIALELGLDSRLVGVNLRAMWVAGYVRRERHFVASTSVPVRRLRADGYCRLDKPRRVNCRLWMYAGLDADLVRAPVAGARC
jgi:hypothetical protein